MKKHGKRKTLKKEQKKMYKLRKKLLTQKCRYHKDIIKFNKHLKNKKKLTITSMMRKGNNERSLCSLF